MNTTPPLPPSARSALEALILANPDASGRMLSAMLFNRTGHRVTRQSVNPTRRVLDGRLPVRHVHLTAAQAARLEYMAREAAESGVVSPTEVSRRFSAEVRSIGPGNVRNRCLAWGLKVGRHERPRDVSARLEKERGAKIARATGPD